MDRIPNRFSARSALALALAAGACATATTSALADDCCRWELRIERTAILSDNFTVELYAHFPSDGFAFASGSLDILSDDIDWVSWDWCGVTDGPGISAGVPTATGDIEDIFLGQIHFPIAGIIADDDNPALVWCGEFEASGDGYRTLTTDSFGMTFYESADTAVSRTCSRVLESVRTVFVGPLVIDEWLASPFPGTIGRSTGDELVLRSDPAGPGGVGAAITAEGAAWAPDTRFEHHVDLGDLQPGAPVDLTWFPWWNCGDFVAESLSATMTRTSAAGEPPTVSLSLNFEEVGAPRVPLTLMLDGERIAAPILGSGQSFRLFDPCFELTWCYVLNSNDQLVLVLKCENPFEIEVGGERYRVDTVMMDPGIGSSGVDGLDRVEIRSREARSLTIGGQGFVDGSTKCRADCDGNGRLDIFDFLCFQNLFASGDLAADLDGDGRLSIFDFLEFQNQFAAGCD
ncbi:MAG: GC-type dockerin domain-anchored protein [Phycisphaerales bacterium]|jgi:hypothetical protein